MSGIRHVLQSELAEKDATRSSLVDAVPSESLAPTARTYGS
jgi:hypothetical protein